jgi:peptidoglycan/LPS O-acetylase OafA/YrhL
MARTTDLARYRGPSASLGTAYSLSHGEVVILVAIDDARGSPEQASTPDRLRFTYRPALDGMRALAVLAVLFFHGGVSWLPGGFLGVDAFFVLSGFLITSLLLSEHARTGRIRLGAFWIRRARRLLPALLAVLVTVVIAYRDLLADKELSLVRGDALAALGYVANWRMIYRGDDYFTRSSSPSPLQHTWSLGIEEQFYVLWPLIIVAILLLARVRNRSVLLAVCVAGAGASAVTAGMLYRPLDDNRAYFGTDARAQALLIGCALAALLSGRLTRSWLPGALGALGMAALLVVGSLWSHAAGNDAWLYRGGFTIGGLAVAAVIAHTMLSPHAPIARVLAVPPLVWLGKISYGVYLWHWPLFGLLTGDRTGLRGAGLLSLRLVVTLGVAVLSYVLIEEPIRSGRWPLRLPLPDLGRAVVGTGAVVAVGITGLLIVVATAPPSVKRTAPEAAPSAPVVTQPASPRPAPMLRPGRRPGALPRVTFFGDSVSWSLGTYLPPQPDLNVTVRSVQGCGIARLPDIMQLGEGHTNYPGCPTWDVRWRQGIEAEDPDVAVILLDRWELMDRKLDGVYQHVGQPGYDAYLRSEMDLALSIVGSRGAQVVLLTAPYTRRAERPDGGLYDEDRPERVNAWNDLVRDMAARKPEQTTVLNLNARVCPNGAFTWDIGQLRIRSDGLHFTPEGVRQWIAPWLMPQLAAIATGSNAVKRGN